MKTLKVLTIASLLSLTLIQVGFAGNGEHCTRHQKHAMHHHERPMMHLLAKLDLSEQQDQQIKQIFDAEKANMQAKHQAKMALMKALHEVASQANFDEQQAQALASRMGALVKEGALQRAKVGNKIYAVLTPAQQENFKHLMEEKMQKRIGLKKPAHFQERNHAALADGFQQL